MATTVIWRKKMTPKYISYQVTTAQNRICLLTVTLMGLETAWAMLHSAHHRATFRRQCLAHLSESVSVRQETVWRGITSIKLHAFIEKETSFGGVLSGSVFQVHLSSSKFLGVERPGHIRGLSSPQPSHHCCCCYDHCHLLGTFSGHVTIMYAELVLT